MSKALKRDSVAINGFKTHLLAGYIRPTGKPQLVAQISKNFKKTKKFLKKSKRHILHSKSDENDSVFINLAER